MIEINQARLDQGIMQSNMTSDAPTTSEWSTILLPAKVRLILEVWRYIFPIKLIIIKKNIKEFCIPHL